MSHWGSYKNDESIHNFQLAIIQTRPLPHLVTQYDTQLTNALAAYADVWTQNIHNTVQNTNLDYPLKNPITILQIFHPAHYTTLITEKNKYFCYDILSMHIPTPVNKLHARLRKWFSLTFLLPTLTPEIPNIATSYTPQQQDGWICALHMLLVSLSAIYQGTVPIL
jgi:hypothetical protein